MTTTQDLMKRTFDLAVASSLLVLLSPVLVVVALLVRVTLGSPVLFRQVRPGRGGVPFTILKFRTMHDAGSETERRTKIASVLRRTSLDELPELVNVVRGDMSLVGPRPLLVEYLPRYSIDQARRHDVRPGMTGLAQVNGRNSLAWDDRLAFDVWYVDNRSLWVDLSILVRTIGVVASGKDAAAPPFRAVAGDP